MALLQHFMALATGCLGALHVPIADVAHMPAADVAFSQPFVLDTSRMVVPIEVDLLRNKQIGSRPLLGEVVVALAPLGETCPPLATQKAR